MILDANAGYNTISQSTIENVPSATAYALTLTSGAYNVLSGDYIQGSTAVFVSGSTGTTINITA